MMDATVKAPELADVEKVDRRARRRRLFALFGIVLLIVAGATLAWWVLIGSHHVSTDNVYVDADVAKIAAQTAGTIQAVNVAETQNVRAGDILVRIDPADARLMMAQAEADYGRAIRKVRQYMAENDSAAADVGAAEARVAQATADLRRRRNLAASGAVSDEELTTARAGYDTAMRMLASARGEAAKHRAMTAGADIMSNSEVRAARAALDMARLSLDRTIVRAPIDGMVAEKRVALGQRVMVGAPLLNIVPIAQAFVNANFKENQLRRVRLGQAVTLTSDLYGGDVVFHGRVIGIGAGTGSAFSVIPAQNASGNWIKIVQRVPVKIALDPRELRDHPLRVGLSMTADIKVR
jgi:membrane fusion protein (multidrug efflux system)